MDIKRIRAALESAKGVKGPYRGHLKKKCPPMGTDAAIAWQAAMLVVNPYKASIFQLVFMSDADRAFFNDVRAYVESMHIVTRRALDKDAYELKSLGAW